MSFAIGCGLLSSVPGICLWVSFPRRLWAGRAAAAAALAFWVFGMFRFAGPRFPLWLACGLCGLAGAAYALYAAWRGFSERERLEAALRGRQERRAGLAAAAAAAKSQGARRQEEEREEMALYGMVKGLSEALSWEEIRPRLEAAFQQYLGLEEFALYAADLLSCGPPRLLASRRLNSSSVGASWDTLSRCLQEHAVAPTEPHVMEAPERAIAVPIRESDEMMGYVYARVPAGKDPGELLRKVLSFTEQTAFAFRRVKLFAELERLSQMDGLTGVYRRGMLDARLKEEVVRAEAFRTGFCLMLLDIDHFKRLNDSYGHPFGDQVLKRIGEVLRAGVYETDFVARYGGEEFALLLPRADPAGVLRKAERVRAAVEREEFRLAMHTVRVTVSIGVAHFPRDGGDAERVIHQADKALYHAKETGRNRVVDVAEIGVRHSHERHKS